MSIERENELAYLLWLERQKPMYELKIEDGETPRKYKIRELKEMKEILEQYQGKEIGVELHRVRKDGNI